MAIKFPRNPSNGDTVVINSITYIYVSAANKWKSVPVSASLDSADVINLIDSAYVSARSSAGGGGASVTTSVTPPLNPSDGDLWYDTTELALYTYYTDDSSNSHWTPTFQGIITTSSTSSGSSGVTTYDSAGLLPSSGNTTGDFGFTTNTKSLYIYDGADWDRVYNGPNQDVYWDSGYEPGSFLQLENDGTATVVTLKASDPEGFPVTYSYDLLPSNARMIDSISQDSGVFTITPSTNADSDAGEFKIRFKATDGLHILSKTVNGSLTFGPAASGNLTGWYDFSDTNSYSGTGTTVYDLSGNGNHLDLTGAGAYSYNSSNGYMTFPDFITYNIGDGFTLGTAFTSAKEIMIVAYFNSGDNYQPILYSRGTTYFIGSFLSGDTVNAPSSAPVHSGETAATYVNGVQATTRGLGFSSINLSTFNSVFSSGHDLSTGGTWTFKGYPSDVWNDQLIVKGWLCWDRVLTNTERQAAHNYWSEKRSVSMATWAG